MKIIHQSIRGLGIALATSLLTVAPASADDTLRIGTEGAYPPFNFIDSDGNLQGFDIDIAEALCEEMDRNCEFVTQNWDGIIPGLLSNRYDAIIASMSITEEREKAVDFTDRYYTNRLQFIGPEDMEVEISDEGLDGMTVGVQRATISGQWLEENMGDVVSIKHYDTQENAYLDLGSGRIDLVLADNLVSHEWLASDTGEGYEFKGDPVFEGDRIAIAVRPGQDELREAFNEALEAIREDGTYAEINERYFPFDIY